MRGEGGARHRPVLSTTNNLLEQPERDLLAASLQGLFSQKVFGLMRLGSGRGTSCVSKFICKPHNLDSKGTTSLSRGLAGRNDPWCALAAALHATNSPGERTQPNGMVKLRVIIPAASLTANSGTSPGLRKCHLKARGTSLLAQRGMPGCLAFHHSDCRATA